MTRSSTEPHKIGHSKALHIVAFVIAMISIMLNGSNARAANVVPSDYRVVAASGKYEDIRQFAVAFRMRPPRRLRARHLELAIGAISTSQETRPFVSFGPVWRLPINRRALFVELGFSPTLIGGSSFNGRDMGGNLHFTTSAAVGATFGARESVVLSLRIQHTSNGGLSSTNPGMDMIGLNFAFDFNK
jgi:hypothetical protein